MDSPVIIAGGGPVGMTLALELAHHGVPSLVLERNATTTRHPKMDLTNGRSMELFRRLGIADELRAAGVPADQPLDIVWGTRLTGHVLHRFDYPSPDESRRRTAAANDGHGTAEPSMRVSQIVLEPVLKAALDRHPLIDARFGWAFESLVIDEDGVSVTTRRTGSDEWKVLRCAYLAGCDGGSSKVRETLGIALEGQHAVGRAYMVHFRSSAHEILSRFGTAYHFQTGMGTLISQDGSDTWTLQAPLPPGTDDASLEPGDVLRRFVGEDFDFEILVANAWSPHLVIAEYFRRDRVALAGDAVHQVIPTGGYGMNTGIGDAVDLGWKLAALVNGWGGAALLPSYEIERRQIAIQNRDASLRHAEVRMAISMKINEAEAACPIDDPAQADAREVLGKAIAELGNAENESWGIEHGYRYEGSPIILTADEEVPAPIFDPLVARPTSFPGSRLPHWTTVDGRAVADLLGREFSLVTIGDPDTSSFVAAAADLGLELAIVPLPAQARRLFERNLLLVRPDQHVAWRGDAIPANPAKLLRQAAGWTNADGGE